MTLQARGTVSAGPEALRLQRPCTNLAFLFCFLSGLSPAVVASPAFDFPVQNPVMISSGGTVTVSVAAGGAGQVYGMCLYLEATPPFRIDSVAIDDPDSGTVWVGNSTGASVFVLNSPPGIIPAAQYAVAYVTVSEGFISISSGAIVAKVVVSVPVGTLPGTQGTLTTNSPAAGLPSEWAEYPGEAVGQDTADLVVVACSGSPASDFDHDCDVDQADFTLFDACYSGPNVPRASGCETKDLDGDGDVDQMDFAIFQRCYSGEGNPADPNCAN